MPSCSRLGSRLGLGCALAVGLPTLLTAQSTEVGAILANGYRFAYREQGHGPAVVFVHGTLADYRSWSGTIAVLTDSTHAIAYSRRYAWPNPWRPDDPPYGVAAEASDLLALIRALRLERPILVGQDAGATISLLAALREPQAIRGLVLVEPPLDSLVQDPVLRQQWARQHREAWAAVRQSASPERPIPAARALVERRDGDGAWDRAAPADRQGMEENAQTIYLTDPSEPVMSCTTLARIPVPVALVQGAVTPARFQRILDGLGGCLPGASRDTIPEAGHAAPLTHPSAFADHLATRWRDLPR